VYPGPHLLVRKSWPRAYGQASNSYLTGHVAITIYGMCAVTFMMGMYALEGRGRRFVLASPSGVYCPASTGSWRARGRLGLLRLSGRSSL
jgi:hypothetical protein